MADQQDGASPEQVWRRECDDDAGDSHGQDIAGVRVVVRQCAGCGDWVRYERMWGFDRAMRQIGMFQARCASCGWQHTSLTLPDR